MEKINRPSFQFYPNDWLCDIELQTCSLAAQGLWINLMCRMHKSVVYGVLVVKQNNELVKLNDLQVAGLVGKPLEEIQPLLDELLSAGIIKVDEFNGAYFCKRMVKDEDIRNKRALAGSAGGKSTQKKNKNKKKELDTESVDKKTIDERKSEFYSKVESHVEFEEDLRTRFFNYWTEKNDGGKKMRFEKEPVFEIKKRLAVFFRNDQKYKNSKNVNNSESHVDSRIKQNLDQKERNKILFSDERTD